MKNSSRMTTDQAIGGVVNQFNTHRETVLQEALTNQNANFHRALSEVKRVLDFIEKPNKILGSNLTKHGEIAEHVEVGIGNAKQFIRGLPARFSFEGVGRTAPEDFIMDGIKAQSKFLNGENNTLRAILEHLEKYKGIDFGRDGSKYVIPKDFYENITALRNGQEIPGYKWGTNKAILEKIQKIVEETDKPFEEVIVSSEYTYKEILMGKVRDTVARDKNELKKVHNEIKNKLKDDSKPSFEEAFKVAAISAGIEGTIQTAVAMYAKKKKISEYTSEDWKEIGFVFAKGSGTGAIRGAAIYGLTNLASMPAPLAASFVSATYGISSLYSAYKRGEISKKDMIEQGEILCFDTTLNLLGNTLGQALIPIPMLGAVIGSISANVLGGIIKGELDKKEKELIQLAEKRYQEYTKKLENELASEIIRLVQRMKHLRKLSKMAFDFKTNASLRFKASQKLALAHGVPKEKILTTDEATDNFFLD